MDKDTKTKYLEHKKRVRVAKDTKVATEIFQNKREREKAVEENLELKAKREELGIVREDIIYKVLDRYIKGESSEAIGKDYGYNSKEINRMLEELQEKFSNTRAANALKLEGSSYTLPILDKLKNLELLNEDFLNKLSDNLSPTLSEEEALFCWLYVHKGDSFGAIEESTLDVGLFKNQPTSYKRGILSRAAYLQAKPNVAAYIKELRERKYYTNDVDKGYVQELILEQIEQTKLRGDRRDSVNLRQLIELLGKTIGAFTEKIEVHEVDPSKSLDLLIEMAKDSNAPKEITN